jgi:hypothetical protein
MYTRRKVFSLAEDNNYDLYQSLYSDAFDEGAEYAERLFAEREIAERNYSDGFDDGFWYAQRLFTTEAEANKMAAALEKRIAKEGTKDEKARFANAKALIGDKGYAGTTGGFDEKKLLATGAGDDFKKEKAEIAKLKKLGSAMSDADKKRLAELQSDIAAWNSARYNKETQSRFMNSLNYGGKSNSIDASNITDYDGKSKLGKNKGYTTDKGRGFEQFDKNGNVIISKKEKEAIEAELKRRAGQKAQEEAKMKSAIPTRMLKRKNAWKYGAIGAGVLGAGATTAALLAGRRRRDDED